MSSPSRVDETFKPPGKCDIAVQVEQKRINQISLKAKSQLLVESVASQSYNDPVKVLLKLKEKCPFLCTKVPPESRQRLTVGLQQTSHVVCRSH